MPYEVTGEDGQSIPPRLQCEVERALQRLALVDEQMTVTEAERDRRSISTGPTGS